MKITLNNIAKKYEGNINYTLEGVNLEIDSGEFLVLLGPSGSGKTTLLRMIAGLITVTKGDLIFGNRRVNNVLPKEREIAMVFQSYALYPTMTVYENIAFSLKMQRMSKSLIREKVLNVAKVLSISHILYKKPSEISGGQRQRVALGRAIIRKPQIFLMDEPLSNLDAKLRDSMRVEIKRLHKMLGTTTIYVTHDQHEAMSLADRIVVIDNNIIQQVGASDDLYFKPANLFVAKFIGTPEINLVPGKATAGVFRSTDGSIKLPCAKTLHGEAILGFRPENIEPVKKDGHFSAEVTNVQHLGSRIEYHADITADLKVSGVASRRTSLIEDKRYNFAISHPIFFDAKTEKRIDVAE